MTSADRTAVDETVLEQPLLDAVGVVDTLWRYPVKSMRGERMSELAVGPRGVVGDRAWALRDLTTGRIASAKTFPRLLEFHARYVVEPHAGRSGRAIITLPNGDEIAADDPSVSSRISATLGRELQLETEPLPDERTTTDRANVFGDVPVEQMKPGLDSGDNARLLPTPYRHLLGDRCPVPAHKRHRRPSAFAAGGTAVIDQRRFRPNVYVDSLPDWTGFVEDSWLGRQLAVGDALVCSGFEPTLWCVTSTLAQEDLPRDLSVLRTTANHHAGCLGVYGAVTNPGVVRVGDPVTLL